MKKIFYTILVIGMMIVNISCADEPEPEIRVLNSRLNKANVQFKTDAGNTVNINDVEPGQLTTYQDLDKGNLTVSAVIQDEPVKPVITFFAVKGIKYTIVIVGGQVASLRIDRE
ncbi:MAG: DUF4397 domain-containing protein [Ignavibacteriaceae bacterium]|nr:DUF4397 domain-containing protein [Ignavibacteriaceae bacterium]